MSPKPIKTLDVRSRKQWRKWLEQHHDSESEIWLVFHKAHTSIRSIEYEDSINEALCFGWVDSLVRRLDDDRFARKFTPRKPDSRWSAINRRRYQALEEQGLLAPAGRERPPSSRSSVKPERWEYVLPAYVEKAFKARPQAWEHFQQLAPSHRRAYVGWIDTAKREETKARRLREAVTLLAAGKKLGLK